MKTLVHSDLWLPTLEMWRGAQASIWLFHTTHKRLALALARADEPEMLYVVANGCEHIVGAFSWRPANISVRQGRSESGEEMSFVVDDEAGFSLRCSGVALVRGPSNELDTSFESFLGDAPGTAASTR
jgi:hypothetical protein